MGIASPLLRRLFAVAVLALASASTLAATTQAFTFAPKSYAGSRERQYKVYLPEGLTGPSPMVMALHGCRTTHDDVLRDWGMTAAAQRFGFILVTPFITSYDGLRSPNCWGFWLEAHRHQGRGEPEDLYQIALEVESRFNVDPARRYVTGLSAGGAMSVVLAITHNEYWAAAASASGLPYGEDSASVSFLGCPGSASFHAVSRDVSDARAELNHPYATPLMLLQNDQDCVVLRQAALNLRDSHLMLFGDVAHHTPATARADQRACTPAFGDAYGCEHANYTVDGRSASRSIAETVFYSGPRATPDTSDTDAGHYWIGGQQGRDGKWALQHGPSYPDIVWDFFARHPREGTAPSVAPRITLLGANPLKLTMGQAFTDPGATAVDPQDGNLPVSADCSGVDSRRAGNYTCTYRATDSEGHKVSATRAVVVEDTSVPGVSCATALDSPLGHVSRGRAVAGGLFHLRALSSGDRQDIGFAWDSWSEATLFEGTPGQWYSRTPPGCPR